MGREEPHRASFFAGLLGAWIAGGLLRFWNLRAQVLGGDELHSVRLAMSAPLGKILFRHTDFDHGRPLTALYRLAMDAGVVFDEMTFRAPILACGLGLAILLPLVAARVFGRGVALVLAWFVALSPVFVLYSRIVRTYLPVVLLAFVAVTCFWLWMGSGRLRHAACYVTCAVTAVFTHVLSAPFVLAPLAFALGERLLRRRGLSLSRWLAVTGVTVGLTVSLYAALWDGIQRLVATRASQGHVGSDTFLQTLAMQAGSAQPALVALFWTAAIGGAWWAVRLAPRLALYAACLCVAQVAAVLVIGPKQSEKALVFDRYILVCTPLVLGAVSVAFGASGPACQPRRIAAAGLAVALFLGGPLNSHDFRHGSFVHHNRFVSFADGRGLPDIPPPVAYAELDAEGPILEFPWNSHWNQSVAPLVYQRSHGREVVVAGRQVTAVHPRVKLRNAVPIDADPPGAFLASRARWLVVHLDMGGEESRFHTRDVMRGEREILRQDGEKMARELTRLWGPPTHADEDVRIWDLAVLRRAGRPGPQRSSPVGR